MSESIEAQEVLNVFFSYAREDEDLRKQLATHLAILKRGDKIDTWHDREMPGRARLHRPWRRRLAGRRRGHEIAGPELSSLTPPAAVSIAHVASHGSPLPPVRHRWFFRRLAARLRRRGCSGSPLNPRYARRAKTVSSASKFVQYRSAATRHASAADTVPSCPGIARHRVKPANGQLTLPTITARRPPIETCQLFHRRRPPHHHLHRHRRSPGALGAPVRQARSRVGST